MNDDKLRFLYEEDTFVVVEKVSGFLSVPGRGPEKQDCVTRRVKEKFPHCIEQPSVHRLDMDTSGLLVVALTKEVHRALSMQFQERKTEKRYIALLEGLITETSGTIELPFRLDVDNRPHQIYDPVHGKVGLTHWQKVGEENGHTRVLMTPITGRTHQLRVHAAHEKGLGVPIVGDPLYGSALGHGEMKLHACYLGFFHPLTGEKLSFESNVSF